MEPLDLFFYFTERRELPALVFAEATLELFLLWFFNSFDDMSSFAIESCSELMLYLCWIVVNPKKLGFDRLELLRACKDGAPM